MKVASVLTLPILSAFAVPPATAITWGSFDEDNLFPSDGALMLDFVEEGRPEYGYGVSCSGVLIHPEVFLTAGHCIYYMLGYSFLDEAGYPVNRPIETRDPELGDDEHVHDTPGIWVSFDSSPSDFDAKGEKCDTCLDIKRAIVNPSYKSNYKDDVGVVILKKKYTKAKPMTLPPEGFLDSLKKQKKLNKSTIINVGYGGSFDAETKKKHDIEYLDMRKISYSTVKSLNKEYLGLNMHENSDNGGTCYADSGGAGYYEDDNGDLIIAGLVSTGDTNCISTDRRARIDVDENYAFVQCIMSAANGEKEYDDCA